MGRRSPSKNKASQNRKPLLQGNTTDQSALGTNLAGLDGSSAPSLGPAPPDEPWSPTRSALRSPTKPLSHQVSSLQHEKDAIDTKLWDATVELQERIRQKQTDDEHISRLQQELSRLRSDREQESQLFESLKSREAELRTELKSFNTQVGQDKRSFLEKIESRDEYIENLQDQIEQLRAKIQGLSHSSITTQQKHDTSEQLSSDTSHSLTADTSVELNFGGSVVPQTPGSSELLSSSHQKRQLMSLRNQLRKQRVENFELKKQLAGITGKSVPDWSSGDEDDESFLSSGVQDESTLPLPERLRPTFSEGFALSDDLLDNNEVQIDDTADTYGEVPESLQNQARAFNHALVPMAEYEKMASKESKDEQPTSFEELKRLAAQLNFSVMPSEEFDHIHRLLHGEPSVKRKVESHVLQDLVRQNTIEVRSPSRKELEWKAARSAPEEVRNYLAEHNLRLIPRSSSSSISGSSSNSPAPAGAHDTTEGKVSSVGSRSSIDEVAAAAASLGLAVLPVKQFERIQSDIKKLHLGQPPAAAEVAQVAKLAGLQVIPENPTIDELRHVTGDDMVIVERDIYKALENPGPATLTRLADTHGMAVLPKLEIERLRALQKGSETKQADIEGHSTSSTTEDFSESKLREEAQKKNLVVLSAQEYKNMTLRSNREFSNLPMSERTDYFEKLIHSQNSPSNSPSRQSPASSLGTMADRIGGMGFLIVKKEEYAQLKQTQQIYNPTKADIIQSAKDHGLATMPIDEYAKLRASKWSSPSKERKEQEDGRSSRQPSPFKGEDDFKAVPSGYLSVLQRIVETPSPADVESMAKKAGVHLVESTESRASVLEKAKELGLVEPLADDQILEKAKILGFAEPLAQDQVLASASELGWEPKLDEEGFHDRAITSGYIKCPDDETYVLEGKSRGLVDPITDEDVISRAQALGYAPKPRDEEITSHAKRLGLMTPPTDDEIRTAALKLGLIEPLKDQEIVSSARKLGLVDPLTDDEVISRARKLGMILSDDEIRAAALKLGLDEPLKDDEIIASARKLGLVDPLTDDEVISRARKMGMVLSEGEIKAVALKLGLVEPLKDDEIRRAALKLGLVEPLKDQEIVASARELGLVDPLTDDEVISRARKLGMVLSDDEIRGAALKLGLVEPLKDDEIIASARKLGLVNPLTDDEVISRARKLGMVLSDDEIRIAALKLGLVEPLKDDEIVASARKLGLIDPLTDDEVISRARKLGMVLSDDEIRGTALKLGLIEPLKDDEIVASARKLGLVDPLTDDEVISRARKMGMVLSEGEIKAAALKLGLVEPLKHDEIRAAALKIGLVEPLKDQEIAASARKLGLADPLTDSEVISRARDLGMVLSENEIRGAALKLGLNEPLKDHEIIASARKLGLVDSVTDEEVTSRAKKLGLVPKLQDDEIISSGMKLGLVNPPNEEEIRSSAAGLGLTEPLREHEILESARQLGLVDRMSDDQVISRAKELGLTSKLSKEEIRKAALELGLAEPLQEHDILASARNLGLCDPISDEEIIDRAKKLGLTSRLSDDQLKANAHKLGLVDPPTEDDIVAAAKRLGLSYPKTDEEIAESARKLGLVDPPTDSQIINRAKELGLTPKLTEDEILKGGLAAGLVEPPQEREILSSARKLGLVDPPTNEQLISRAKQLGLVSKPNNDEIMASAKRLGLIEPPTENDIRASAVRLGLREPLQEHEILKSARSLGLVDPPTNDEIIERAKKLGLTFPSSKDDGGVTASSLGSTPRAPESGPLGERNLEASKPQRSGLIQSPSVSSISDIHDTENEISRIEKNDIQGLNSSSKTQGNSRAPDLPSSDSTIGQDQNPPTTSIFKLGLESGSGLGASGSRDTNSKDGSSGKSIREFRPVESGSSRDVDVFVTEGRPSEAAAAAIAPRLASSQKFNSVPAKLASEGKLSSTGLPKTMSTRLPVRNTPRKYEVRSTSPHKANSPLAPHTNMSSYSRQRLDEHTAPSMSATGDAYTASPRAGMSSKASHRRTPTDSSVSDTDLGALPLPRIVGNASGRKDTGLSANTFSTWSVKSLTGEDATQFLAQLIMGEVLYKYYGGLNFEGITGGRHRRYFWFRPDSRKLYWTRENPQFLGHGNPKSLTVVQVEEQIDRNPLPTGLYHRTLIIRGVERDVRVTCTTQGRHYVWLVTLRHILSQTKATD